MALYSPDHYSTTTDQLVAGHCRPEQVDGFPELRS